MMVVESILIMVSVVLRWVVVAMATAVTAQEAPTEAQAAALAAAWKVGERGEYEETEAAAHRSLVAETEAVAKSRSSVAVTRS